MGNVGACEHLDHMPHMHTRQCAQCSVPLQVGQLLTRQSDNAIAEDWPHRKKVQTVVFQQFN